MFCPRCGQEQISPEVRFCSRCGLLMTGVGALIANEGNTDLVAPKKSKPETLRRRGLKQGLFIFLLTFLIVPIITILTVMAGAEPFAVVISAILLSVGGLLRMVYAWMFESNETVGTSLEESNFQSAPNLLNRRQTHALPPEQSIPASSYVPPKQGNWRDTNDLEPTSVTDPTTKLLSKEK